MLRIRLTRVGKKKQPSYRIVVADSRSPRDGRFLKIIGHYNPRTEPVTLDVKEDEAVRWLQQGARPSDTAAKLLTRLGVMEKAGKAPVKYEGKDVPPAPKAKKGTEAAAPASAPAAVTPAAAPAAETPPAEPEPAPETEAAAAAKPETTAEAEATTEPEAAPEPEATAEG